jgi:hypothetical protein
VSEGTGVRSYYAGTLAVPFPVFEPCAILFASGRTARSDEVDSPEGASEMDMAYASWIGLPVVLQVVSGDIKVPLRGKLLKDKGDTVRIRIDGSDIDIYKTMILAVEEDAMVMLPA